MKPYISIILIDLTLIKLEGNIQNKTLTITKCYRLFQKAKNTT